MDVRAVLVGVLRAEKFHATMMEQEGHRKRPGDDFSGLFDRITREMGVDRYLVYWPHGANLLGLAWELRHLRDEMKAGRLTPEQVHLFTEGTVGHFDVEGGAFSFSEKHNRTWYFDDPLSQGCTPRPWTSYEELRAKVIQAAGEEIGRGE